MNEPDPSRLEVTVTGAMTRDDDGTVRFTAAVTGSTIIFVSVEPGDAADACEWLALTGAGLYVSGALGALTRLPGSARWDFAARTVTLIHPGHGPGALN